MLSDLQIKEKNVKLDHEISKRITPEQRGRHAIDNEMLHNVRDLRMHAQMLNDVHTRIHRQIMREFATHEHGVSGLYGNWK